MPISFYLCGQNVTDTTTTSKSLINNDEDEGNKSDLRSTTTTTNFVKIQIPHNVVTTAQLLLENISTTTTNEGNHDEKNTTNSTNNNTSSIHSYSPPLKVIEGGDASPTFIQKISCGSDFLIVLLNDGSLYSMGSNTHGQLGINLSDFTMNTFPNRQLVRVHTNRRAKLVECGAHFTLFATVDNRLFGFGTNDYNQILYTRPQYYVDIDTTTNTTTSTTNTGSNDFMEPIEIDYDRKEGMHEITHLGCCFSFSMFVLNGYELRMIGQNWVYEHGHHSLINSRHTPQVALHKFKHNKVKKITCGGFHFVILLENGQLFGAGDCSSKQYGSFASSSGGISSIGGGSGRSSTSTANDDSEEGCGEIFVDIGKKYFRGMAPIRDVVCGGDSTVVQLMDGSIHFCGINNMNQFIQNFRQIEDMTRIQYDNNEKILKVYSGEDFSCAITMDGKCILRGNNDKTQLGICSEMPIVENSFKLNDLFSNKELKNLDEIQMACGYYNTVIYRKPGNDIFDHFPLLSNSRRSLHDITMIMGQSGCY